MDVENQEIIQEKVDAARPGYAWLAVLSIVLTLVAWVCATGNGIVAMLVGAVAILCGAFAERSPRGGVRNVATTSIIAATVLLVVIAAFMLVVKYALS